MSKIEALSKSEIHAFNQKVIEDFRAKKGQVRAMLTKAPLLLLHTTGAKSGLPRINPLGYLANGERLVVMASQGGAPTHPDWYYNLVANPEVRVEVGTEQFQAQATVATEPERTELFAQMVAAYPTYGEYQQKASPHIVPVIILTRKP